MRAADALLGVKRLFLDTAPVVYYVEEHPTYLERVVALFDGIDAGDVVAFASPITLAECLVQPYRMNNQRAIRLFMRFFLGQGNVEMGFIDQDVGVSAARFRAVYNLSTTDSFQLAVALRTQCDAFLTNDRAFERVSELRVILVDAIAGPA